MFLLRNKLIFLSLSSTLLIFLFGCASTSERVNLVHVHEANVYEDEKSVFYSNDNLNQLAINSMLNSKVVLPTKIKIAIIRLRPNLADADYKAFRISKNITNEVQADPIVTLQNNLELQTQYSQRDISCVIVPESLIPAKADLKVIRNLGVALQANLILVVDSRNDRLRDKQIIKNNLAMSVASADTYLIDAQTGVILNANSYTNEAIAEKSDQDFNLYQTLDRARLASEKKIFKKLAFDVKSVLETIK